MINCGIFIHIWCFLSQLNLAQVFLTTTDPFSSSFACIIAAIKNILF